MRGGEKTQQKTPQNKNMHQTFEHVVSYKPEWKKTVALQERTCRNTGMINPLPSPSSCFGVRFSSCGSTPRSSLRGNSVTWCMPCSSARTHCPGGGVGRAGTQQHWTDAPHGLMYPFYCAVLLCWALRGSSWVPVPCYLCFVNTSFQQRVSGLSSSLMTNGDQKPYVPPNKALPFRSPTWLFSGLGFFFF